MTSIAGEGFVWIAYGCVMLLLLGGMFYIASGGNLPTPEIAKIGGLHESPVPLSSASTYGCPGCPQNFMGFAKDMCSRGLGMETVTDGTNTLQCSEITDIKKEEQRMKDSTPEYNRELDEIRERFEEMDYVEERE